LHPENWLVPHWSPLDSALGRPSCEVVELWYSQGLARKSPSQKYDSSKFKKRFPTSGLLFFHLAVFNVGRMELELLSKPDLWR
jgi:hypothetical protein